jgi:hypothetical protein
MAARPGLIGAPAAKLLYVNYKGEPSYRYVMLYENGVRHGTNEWHTTPQYLLRVYDIEKAADREFAMKDIKEWS